MKLGPAPNVRIAFVDGDLIIFDITRDDYLAVARTDATETASALLGKGYCPDDPVLTELLDQKLIVAWPDCWKPDEKPHPVALPPARTQVQRFRFLMPFLRATLGTWLALQRRSTRWTISPSPDRRSENLTPYELASIVERFARWRIFVPGSGRCLVQSMILMRFLAYLHIDAEWVFGIRTHPFEAHCWVERDGMILNDAVDHARWYTVIARF